MRATLGRRVAGRVVLSELEQDVLRVILYFDVFGHPLTPDEVYTYLPARASSRGAVDQALKSLLRKTHLQTTLGFYFLRSCSDRCVRERLAKEQRAVRRLRIAGLVGRFISFFPFVRGIMISGELSKGLAGPHSDIDFVVVAKEGRLWICRTVLIAFKKLFLLNSKKYFCLNHFITENNLAVDSRNFYTALELATLKPVVNRQIHARYLMENEWIREFFPHWELSEHPRVTHNRPLVRTVLENVLPRRLADRLEVSLMARWQRIWNRRYAHLSDADRNHMFRCLPGISTAYGEDFQRKVLNTYAYRLRKYGVPPLGQTN